MNAAVILAAGSSRRWGAGNKLFDRFAGKTMLTRTLRIAEAMPVQRLIVIVGWQAARVRREVRRRSACSSIVVVARDHREGLGASLRAAFRTLRPIDRAVLLLLADMPWIDPRSVSRLSGAAGPIVRPAWRGRPGHPVLLRGAGIAALARARGDKGPGRSGARLVRGDRRCIADRDRPGIARAAPPRL